MTTDATASRGGQLDELNTATLRRHARNVSDRGIRADDPESALYRAYQPDGGTLLADLRANAETVYGTDRAPAKTQGTGRTAGRTGNGT